MSTRTVLKSFFETGDKPTESQFADLIDSLAHLTDDFISQVEAEGGVSSTPRIWSAERVKQAIDANPSAGDIVGPASSGDENIPIFDGTTGKLIKDSGISFADLEGVSGTSTIYGLETSINLGDNTKFDISAGLGVVANNYTDPSNPTISLVLKSGITSGITVTNLATQDLTFVGINSSGTIIQQSTLFTSEQRRDIITNCTLIHPSRTQIDDIAGIKIWNKDLTLSLNDLGAALGAAINIDGNVYSANGANLKIDRSSGQTFSQWGNYDINKKNVNILPSTAESALQFILFKADGVVSFTDNIPNTQYDPNKTGVLEDLTDGYFTVHRIYWEPVSRLTSVQYGQFEYDSQLKALKSWEKECFIKTTDLTEVQLRQAIIIQKGTTALNDDDKVKFAEAPALGDKVFTEIPTISRFAESIEIIDGMSYQRPSITYVNDGGTLYADVEADGTGNITYVFAQKEYILDCTTGSGVGGRARVALTAGTATVPVQNYLYITRSGSVAQLNASISKPSGQFGWLAQVLLPDATTFNTTGVYSTQRNSDNKSHDGRGALSYEREKIRDGGVDYQSGIAPTITIDPVPTPDTLDVSFTGGVIKQLHDQTIPALSSATDGIYIINHPTTPWLRTTDLETITIDANGTTLENTAYNFVFVGIASSADGVDYSKIGCLLPNGSYAYTDLENALQDPSSTAVTSVPQELKRTAYLIARVTFKLKNNVLNNVVEDELSPKTFFDLRGTALGANAGGVGAPSVSSFLDNVFNIISNVNGFTLQWVLDNLTANRTVTWPDISGLAAIYGMTDLFSFGGQVKSDEYVQSWSAATTHNMNNGNFQSSVVNATSIISLTNKSLGSGYTIDYLIDATGGYTLTFDSSFGSISPNGESSPLSVLANERYIISILHSTNGTTTIITKN